MKTPAFIFNEKTGLYQVIPEGYLKMMPNGRMGMMFHEVLDNHAKAKFLTDNLEKFERAWVGDNPATVTCYWYLRD